jgi:beta-exotoxin I transport system permease protein
MLRNAFAKTLRDARRAIGWWSLGLIATAALMIAVYPSVRDNPDLNKMVENYPDAFKAFLGLGENVDYTSAVGYLNSELFAFMVPLLLLIAAIGAGARATAGEEERGTLDLLLANPISRRRLVLEKLAALAAEIAILASVLWLALLVGIEAIGMNISPARLAAATLAAALLAFAFGAIALFLGAALGRRGAAIGIAAAGAVAAYLISSLAELVDFLKPLRGASPFYHYTANDALRAGLAVEHIGFLLLLGVAAVVAALIAFQRRDLATP